MSNFLNAIMLLLNSLLQAGRPALNELQKNVDKSAGRKA